MKASLISILVLLVMQQACTQPCETQSFYFGDDTITFPIDVKTIMRNERSAELSPGVINIVDPTSDTTKRYRYSLFYQEDRFAPDGSDDEIENARGIGLPDTLGKGIYAYCYYLPEKAYEETLQYLIEMYGDNYKKTSPSVNSIYEYYSWELSECTRLVFSSIRSPLSNEAFESGERVTFVEFVHRLTDREISYSVDTGGFKGKLFD